MKAFRLLAAAPLLAAALPCPADADVLVDNVNGVTLDEHGHADRFTGLLIGDDGRVAQVLHRGDRRPRKVDYQLDGKGRVLIPGLIDAHAHVMATGFAALSLDLSDVTSLAAAQARIAAYAAAHPDRPWIMGRGWSAERWGLAQPPTSADLDAAVSGRPVWLISADGGAGWANSAALAAGGITAATRSPPGGRVEYGNSGKPTGVLVGTAMGLVERSAPPPRPEDRDLAFSKAQQAFLCHGFTTVTDMGTTIEDWQTYRRAGDAGRLQMRIVGYAEGIEAMSLIAGPSPTLWLYDDRLKLNGVSLAIDGTVASGGALLTATNTGLSRYNDTQLNNLMSRAAIDAFQVAITAHGDGAVRMALDAIDQLVPTYRGDRRWRIEGAEVIAPGDLPRFGRNGIAVALTPAANRPGMIRSGGNGIAPGLAAAGPTLAFGSGAPVGSPNPFAGIARAISPPSPVSAAPVGQAQEAALAAFTIGAARAAFAEARVGRLDRGSRADFLLLDTDPLLASAAELAKTRVLQVWIGGHAILNGEATFQSPSAR